MRKQRGYAARMHRKTQPKNKPALNGKASMTTYAESYIRQLFTGTKGIKRKDRKSYYAKIPEEERERFLKTYPTWKKDVLTDETNERLAAYAKIFIKNVPKDERAKFYKNLNKNLKEDFLKDYPDWRGDV